MLDIDTAIKHCLEVAEQNDIQADKWQEEGGEEWGKTTACRECAAEQRQLAEWLTELKELRENYSAQTEVIGFFKSDNKQLDERMKEAKRLLKMAVEDINECVDCFKSCDECCCDQDNHCHWKHEAEALKLIGEDEGVNT